MVRRRRSSLPVMESSSYPFTSTSYVRHLCTPALLYFVFGILWMLMSLMQNYHHSSAYTLGFHTTSVPSTFMVLVIQLVYVMFWTYVLNLICADGHSTFAWLMVLFPILLQLVLLLLLFVL